MRRLLRSRRGTVAFAAVIAAIPLIGVVGLGAEAGSWYVTKQHAQNAADAAAYSGALRLACTLGAAGGTPCADTQPYDYRGKQFAAQNAFCNAGDTAYPGTRCVTPSAGTSQTVTIATATSAAGPWTNPAGASFVRATVNQTQPTYLAAVLGMSTVTIGAQAIAQVQQVAQPCVLALTGSISFQGSPNINAGCGLASNSTAKNALDFTGGGMTLTSTPLYAAGGCTGSTTFCGKALTNSPPITNPFAALDAITMPTLSNCTGSVFTAYSAATKCKNNNFSISGNASKSPPALTGGVYFIWGTLSLHGGATISGTALFILLPGASIDTAGGSAITITGNASVSSSQVPTEFSSYTTPSCTASNTCLFNNLAIYDQSNVGITMKGNSNVTFNGDMYLPNAQVTFQGNPTVSACGQLVAKAVAFNGNATFDNSGCKNNFHTGTPQTQVVALVK
jgi:Flp pilus assembly protein TadG